MTDLPDKPPPINPFALKAALKALDEQGIEVGTIVTVRWTVPGAYDTGAREYTHTGPLKYLDRERGHYEIAPTNSSPGHYRGYLLSQTSTLTKTPENEAAEVKVVAIPSKNPFINRSKPKPSEPKKQRPVKRPVGKTENPFLKRR